VPEIIDKVAVELTAEIVDFVRTTDRALTHLEQAGGDAGEAFARQMTENLMEAGEQVREQAEIMGASFEEAIGALHGADLFTAFSEGDLLRAAGALEVLDFEMGNLGRTVDDTEDRLNRFKEIIDETPKTISETNDVVERLIKLAKEYGKTLDAEVLDQIKEEIRLMEERSDGTEFATEMINQQKDAIIDAAEAHLMAEQAVRKVVKAYKDLGLEIPNALQRDQIRNHIKSLLRHQDEFGNAKDEADNYTKGLIDNAQAMKDMRGPLGFISKGLELFGVNLSGVLGQVASGVIIFTALKKAFNEIQEATKFAAELTVQTQELSDAFRINQLRGEENTATFRDWYNLAEEVADITGQSLAPATEAVTDSLRELGASSDLTDDQITELIRTGAVFTKQYGGTLPQAINQLSGFINTGVNQSLETLGINISKARQNAKAWELGLGSNIDKLSEADQAYVRFALTIEELQMKTVGLDDGVRSFSDRLDDAARKSEQAKKELGDLFVPILVRWKEFRAQMFEGFANIIKGVTLGLSKLASLFVSFFLAIGATAKAAWDTITTEGFGALEGLGDMFLDAWAQADAELFEFSVRQMTGGLDEFGKSAEGAADAVGEFGEEAAATAEEVEAFIEAARKYDEGMARIEQRFLDRMDDITEQFRQRRADLETDFLRDLRDIDAEAAVDRLEAIRDYQVEEIRLREDHALEIRQLEERYLLDLEDAVRDRDARQVLNLQRRFNLEKKQRQEDYNLRQKRLKENFSIEMQEIEFQRQRRRQERDLLEQLKNRLEALQAAADAEVAIQQDMLDRFVDALNETYGTDGPWVQYHQAAVETAQNAATEIHKAQGQIIESLSQTEGAIRAHVRFQEEAAQRVNQAWASRYTGLAGETVNLYGSTARQRGGTVFATSPTNIMAGEGRPERVDITPLSAGTGQPSAGFRGGGGGRVEIDLNVDASELLMVEVADQTMNDMADVLVNLNQRGAQGGRIGR